MGIKKVKTVWIVKYKGLKDISSTKSMLHSRDSVTGVEKKDIFGYAKYSLCGWSN